MAIVSISKMKIEKQKGVVILPLKEYRRLVECAAPIYYLADKEAKSLDTLVERGLREHRKGKTRIIRSLSDLD